MKFGIVRTGLLIALLAACTAAFAQNVKITPLGSHAGELCMRDRATIFEDPTGVRILYDAGVSFALGPPSGYVIRFTNGLVPYLTGGPFIRH